MGEMLNWKCYHAQLENTSTMEAINEFKVGAPISLHVLESISYNNSPNPLIRRVRYND